MVPPRLAVPPTFSGSPSATAVVLPDASVRLPVMVNPLAAALPELVTVPELATFAPTVPVPARFAPAATFTSDATEPLTTKVPASILVPPVQVLLPVTTSVPGPDSFRLPPVPPMSLAKVEVVPDGMFASNSPNANSAGPCTARSASTIPQPHCAFVQFGIGVAVVRIVSDMLGALIHGNACQTCAVTPVTIAVAADVPTLYPVVKAGSAGTVYTCAGAEMHQSAATPHGVGPPNSVYKPVGLPLASMPTPVTAMM